MVWGGDPRGISIIQDEKLHIIGCVQQKKQLSKRFMLCCQQLEGSAERSSETLPTLLIHSIVDEGLDINDIVNIVGEDLGHPLPDDNENRGRNEKPRNQNYFEITIPRYTDIQFVEHFRMSRGTFEELLNIVAPVINQQENANVSISKKLMFTIWT